MSSFLSNCRETVFPLGIPMSWRQLVSDRKRFIAALAGITAAVTMMLFQLGLYDALFSTVVRPHTAMLGDLVLISKNYTSLAEAGRFNRVHLYRAISDEAIASVASVYVAQLPWKNPDTMQPRDICLLACRPLERAFSFRVLQENPSVLKMTDEVFFDSDSRPEFGPVPARFLENGAVVTEVDGKRIKIRGFFQMGSTFAADGNLLMGDQAFFRLVNQFPKEQISVGLLHLKPGHKPPETAARLQKDLPNEVRVVTRAQFLRIEQDYWARRTPIGFVISASMIVGLLVGGIIIYQILYSDVSDHIFEYATLKAIGFSDRFFMKLILEQSLILSMIGFLPGVIFGAVLFRVTKHMAHLPTELSVYRAIVVLLLTTTMCGIGGLFAAKKLKSAEPADLF